MAPGFIRGFLFVFTKGFRSRSNQHPDTIAARKEL